jgi:hypothetical protein
MEPIERQDWGGETPGRELTTDVSSSGIARSDWGGGNQEITAPAWGPGALDQGTQQPLMQAPPPSTAMTAGGPLAQLTQAWDSSFEGGSDAAIAEANGYTAVVLDELTPTQAKYVESSFLSLPENTLAAIMAELAQGSLHEFSMLSQDELGAAIDTEEGEILYAHWGDQAHEKISRCYARIRLMAADLPPEDVVLGQDFFAGLPVRGRVAIMCMLAE